MSEKKGQEKKLLIEQLECFKQLENNSSIQSWRLRCWVSVYASMNMIMLVHKFYQSANGVSSYKKFFPLN